MTITEMRTLVRQDLHDADAASYRWTDDELDRHISHAVRDFSAVLPLEQKAVIATTAGSREISIFTLSDRVMIEAVEYPSGRYPPAYQRFTQWNDVLSLLGAEVPDGSDCTICYGKLHTLDSSGSTIPPLHEDLIVSGAAGYAAWELSVYLIERVNNSGLNTPLNLLKWGLGNLTFFRSELKRLGRKNRVRVKQLYTQ